MGELKRVVGGVWCNRKSRPNTNGFGSVQPCEITPERKLRWRRLGIGITVGVYYLQACGGAVDVLDIALVANRWDCALGGACFDDRFDLNGDDVISVADVMLVAAQWNAP